MSYTPVKVRAVKQARFSPLFLIGVVMAIAGVAGIDMLYHSLQLPVQKSSGHEETSAAALSLDTSSAPIPSGSPDSTSLLETQLASSSGSVNGEVLGEEDSPNPPKSVSNTEERSEKRIALDEVIGENETELTRLISEIERVKNESVEIVNQFNTNCGSWTEDCATEYESSLEKNNATYSDLAGRRARLEDTLNEERTERASLGQ